MEWLYSNFTCILPRCISYYPNWCFTCFYTALLRNDIVVKFNNKLHHIFQKLWCDVFLFGYDTYFVQMGSYNPTSICMLRQLFLKKIPTPKTYRFCFSYIFYTYWGCDSFYYYAKWPKTKQQNGIEINIWSTKWYRHAALFCSKYSNRRLFYCTFHIIFRFWPIFVF